MRFQAMKIIENYLKKDFKYIYKEQRLNIHHFHLTFQLDSNMYSLQSNMDFQEYWLDVIVFISPTPITIGSESYWEVLQTVNYMNWYTKSAGRFYIDSFGDLCFSIRLKYELLEKLPLLAVKEIEAAIDYYSDLFTPFINVCEGKATFEQVKQLIDYMYDD